jgi:1-acyl-sn-glycerol-3-phosphate acyltransferase
MLYKVFRFLLFIVFKLFFRLQVKGKEYIPKKGGFILASNHISYLDPMVLGVACPRLLNFMAKQDLFRNPLFSWLISTVGSFPVKRESVDISALKEAMQRLRNGKALLLFPEGRRGEADAVTSQPQGGVGFLAAKLNVAVVPAFIKGTEKALPKGAKFIRPSKISVYFGKQIQIERGMPYQDIAKLIMAKIRHLSC